MENKHMKRHSTCLAIVVLLLSCLTLWPHGLQHSRLYCHLLSPGVCSSSHPLSQWCYLTISSSAVPFSFCLQCFPASVSFPMNQSSVCIRWQKYWNFSFSTSPSNIQGWFPLGLTGSIPLQSKGLLRAFSGTTVQKHQL